MTILHLVSVVCDFANNYQCILNFLYSVHAICITFVPIPAIVCSHSITGIIICYYSGSKASYLMLIDIMPTIPMLYNYILGLRSSISLGPSPPIMYLLTCGGVPVGQL